MPKGLERREASRPPGSSGKRIVELLDVAVLDAETAVRTVITAVDEGRFGTGGTEARDILRFLVDVWERSPERLKAHKAQLGAIRVPVKTSQRRNATWRRADDTYFSSAWLGDGALEAMYGS